MKRSKKIFLIVSALFFLLVIAVSIDISRKTSFPGSKKHLKENLINEDSTEVSPPEELEKEQEEAQ